MTTTPTPVALEALDYRELESRTNDLEQRRRGLVEQMTALTAKVDAEGRSALTTGEQERFDRLEAGAEKIATEHGAYKDEAHRRIFRNAQDPRNVTRGDGYEPSRHSTRQQGTTAAQGMALRAIEGDYASDDARKEAATKLAQRADERNASYLAAIADPAYLRGWAKMFADPVLGPQMLDPDEARALHEVRASSVGVDSAGGYGTPLAIDPTIHITAAAAAVNPFAVLTKNVTITTDKWRGLTSAGATASWDGEAVEVSDDAPVLANHDITTERLQVFVPASIEVVQDYVGFASEVAKVLADAAMRAEHTAFVTGSGTDQPWGFQTRVDGSASELAPATAEVFAVADVYSTAAALPERHWANASWAMNRGTSFDVRQFADGSSTGQHAFWSDFNGDTPSKLLGRPVAISSELDSSAAINPAATADNFVLAIADWQAAYAVVRRIGFTIELIPHLFGDNGRPTGERGFYGYLRVGGDILDVNAIRLLSIPTAA